MVSFLTTRVSVKSLQVVPHHAATIIRAKVASKAGLSCLNSELLPCPPSRSEPCQNLSHELSTRFLEIGLGTCCGSEDSTFLIQARLGAAFR
jgi:hypothetical protein